MALTSVKLSRGRGGEAQGASVVLSVSVSPQERKELIPTVLKLAELVKERMGRSPTRNG